jgi:hypothetical protein
VTVTFENLQIDQSNLATAGVITLFAPLDRLEVSGGPVTSHGGKCGTDLIVESGARITKTAPGEVKVTGPMMVELPYRDAKGTRAVFANFQNRSGTAATLLPKDPQDRFDTIFELHDTGQLRLHLSGARAIAEHPGDFDLAGFNFKPETLDLDLPAGGTPSTLTLRIPSGVIQSPLPSLITQDDKPLQLKAAGIEINPSGQPSFSKATVGTSNTSLAPAIFLVKPLDFGLWVHQAEVTVKDGAITEFKVTDADLVLPERLNSVAINLTTSGSKIGGAPPLDLLDPQKMARIQVATNTPVKISFAKDTKDGSGHSLQAEGSLLLLDLSSEGPADADKSEPGVGGPAWQGLFFPTAKVDGIPATNFIADGFGVTGVATAKATQEIGNDGGPKYQLVNVKGGETFRRSELVSGGGYTGDLQFPGDALSPSIISVRGAFSGNLPPTLVVDPQDPPQAVTVLKHGMMHLTIAAGTFTSGRLTLGGVLDFPGAEKLTAAGAAFVFQDLPLMPDGSLAPPNGILQFAQPMEVDIGTFKLQAAGLSGFQETGGDLRLDGAIDIAGDLPIADAEQFKGIPIGGKGEIDLGQFTKEQFHLDVPVAGVGRIIGDIGFQEEAAPGETAPVSYLGGKVDFYLGDGNDGDQGGKGAALDFKVASGAWFVQADVNLKPLGLPALPVGSTGLYLKGFHGAFGHNVKPEFNAIGEITKIYLAPKESNFFFAAGVRVSLEKEDSLWFDVLLSVDTDPLLIDLQGDVYVQEPYLDTPDKPDPANLSRYGSVAVVYNNAEQSFRAAAEAHVYLPDRHNALLTANGSMDFLISPSDKHFYIGWPFPANAVKMTVLKGFSSEGGAAIVLQPNRRFDTGFKWSMSLGPLSGEVDGSVGMDFDEGLIAATLHASGEVDFCVFTVRAEAGLTATVYTDPIKLHYDGILSGSIETWVGDLSASVHIVGELE